MQLSYAYPYSTEQGWTPLHAMVYIDHEEGIEKLLNDGFDPDEMAPRRVSLQALKTVPQRAAGLRSAKFKTEKSGDEWPQGVTPMELAMHLGRARAEEQMRRVRGARCKLPLAVRAHLYRFTGASVLK